MSSGYFGDELVAATNVPLLDNGVLIGAVTFLVTLGAERLLRERRN